ncbi:arginine-glutamic acid dipeptide repeats protein-like [Gadus macrocephalus]|uniref:arginine-glutamic acid dipeptide repeats protein-like n=1 Tax=Gadus macrocephalus TaxID=80720 RepID=UPI0028CB8216|nr:arginine-glutamic acid dipeptide repeats protein-like [Gadus macrocephalus]
MEPREQEAELRPDEAEDTDRHCMVNLLKRILTLDSNLRISPMSALRHPFLTLKHLSGAARFSCYHHNATQAMEQASLVETAPAQISREVQPRQPPLPPRPHTQGHPNARLCCARPLRDAHLPRPGPPASPAGSSCPPCEALSDGLLTQQLDEPSFMSGRQNLDRPTEAQNPWERQVAVRSSLADSGASNRDPKGSDTLSAPRAPGQAGVPSRGRVPVPCGGPTGESPGRPYRLFPAAAARSSPTQRPGCRPGPDVRPATWTPHAPVHQAVAHQVLSYSLPHPTDPPHRPPRSLHHPQHRHPGAGSHQFPQGEWRFPGPLGGGGPRTDGPPSSFQPSTSTAGGHCFHPPARSSWSDPYLCVVGRCPRWPEGHRETPPPLPLLCSSCTRETLCTPTPVALHPQTHTGMGRNEFPTQDRNKISSEDRNEVKTEDKHEVQIPVPVKQVIDVQTQTMEPEQYEVHTQPQPELQAKPPLQHQPQAPALAGPPSDLHPDLGQPGPGPGFQAENQPQESRVQHIEVPYLTRDDAKDQGAETDDHQPPSKEASVLCGSEGGSTFHPGQHLESPGRV